MKKLILIIAIVFSGMLFVAGCQKENDPNNIGEGSEIKYLKEVHTYDSAGTLTSSSNFIYDNDWNIKKMSAENSESYYEHTNGLLSEYYVKDLNSGTIVLRTQLKYFNDLIEEWSSLGQTNPDSLILFATYYHNIDGKISNAHFYDYFNEEMSIDAILTCTWQDNNLSILQIVHLDEDGNVFNSEKSVYQNYSDVLWPYPQTSIHDFFVNYPTEITHYNNGQETEDYLIEILEKKGSYPKLVYDKNSESMHTVEYIYYN